MVTGRAGWDFYDTCCYGLTYHVEASEEDASLPLNRIELLSLKCNDA